MIRPQMSLYPTHTEKDIWRKNYSIIGVDEVGVGALAGPVVVCALAVAPQRIREFAKLRGVKDSKLLLPKQRERLAEEIKNTPGVRYKIRFSHASKIDRVNIRAATWLAMRRAVNGLNTSGPAILLVDGKQTIPQIKIEQRAVVRGDRLIFSIACASILAKVFRDRLMRAYDRKYPAYGFARHKGYGTAEHFKTLISLGPTPIHRRSFNLAPR